MPMSATSQTFVTFAYGSNMLTSRIQARCPSARTLGTAELRGYELKWHKRSSDGSGKCDVVRTNDANHVVYGVLYEIPASEKSALDAAEGLGHGYEAKDVEVVFERAPRRSSVYYATAIDASLRPYTWYMALVVAGAKENQLPEKYIEQLAKADAMADSDSKRHHLNTELAARHRQGTLS
mgnify:CR=1 FL=1